jgi:hypothetical protein
MSRQQGEVTILTKANSRSHSLRTTVPMSIIRHFSLSEGDHLRWEIQAKESKLFVVINPLK